MSYSITVYPIGFYEKVKKLDLNFDETCEFLEVEDNLVNFTEEQTEKIEDHLKYRGYSSKGDGKTRKDFTNKKYPSVSVMLTKNALFFNARGGDDVMEISMTSAEFKSSFGLKGFFAVFDTQNETWKA